jgi:nucleotide-binding universal stress UspA family protein
MSRVLAALDDSPSAARVLAAAAALARALAADVDAIHVNGDGAGVAERVARAHGLTLRGIEGSTVDGLIRAGLADDVVAMAVGARGHPDDSRPLGSTALAVATSLPKPVLVVPTAARIADAICQVLIPVEGDPASTIPPMIIELAQATECEDVVLHVQPEAALPAFSDQPQHERDAWMGEFLRRYCHWPTGVPRLQTRVGRPEDLVPAVAEEVDADLVALSWSRELSPGRAEVVRAVLERCQRPVLLVPADAP